ncbi:MAG TPA: alpha/beta fold hydrolase [Polyangiaceae bacterium]|nr:alpha/beta fold hydrolase [Polyangiaceae bacterium]
MVGSTENHVLKILRVACLILLWTCPALAHPPAQGRPSDVQVVNVRLPVTLSDGKTYSIAGKAYYEGSARDKVLQLAIHGITYDHRYWDTPSINGVDYSYARFMARRGYVVLAIDQLGAGKSDRPDGDFLDLAETSSSIAQLVSKFRSRNNPLRVGFEQIVLVGHSFGGLTATAAQASCSCADGLVISGWLHDAVPPVDPAVIQSLLGEPYVTIPQPIRQIFYHLPAADPDVMAFDEQNISTTLTRGQLLSIVASFTTSPSSALAGMVTVPVLVQVGQFDTLMSQRTVSNEDASYAASPSVTTQELPNQGHVLNLHPGNEEGWRYVEAWLDYRF